MTRKNPKVYIASHCKELAEEERLTLESRGYTVVSRWHKKEFLHTDCYSLEERYKIAHEDFEDILSSDILVLLSGPEKYSGGKFIKAGLAYGLGLGVYVKGRKENMLTYLFNDYEELDDF